VKALLLPPNAFSGLNIPYHAFAASAPLGELGGSLQRSPHLLAGWEKEEGEERGSEGMRGK